MAPGPAYPAPPGYAPAPGNYGGPQAYPVAPGGYVGPQWYPAPYGERRFHIRLMRHTDVAIWWYNQTCTFTSTLQECERAYHDAQVHNYSAGWWSIASVLVWNWVSIFHNLSALSRMTPLRECLRPVKPEQFAPVATVAI